MGKREESLGNALTGDATAEPNHNDAVEYLRHVGELLATTSPTMTDMTVLRSVYVSFKHEFVEITVVVLGDNTETSRGSQIMSPCWS